MKETIKKIFTHYRNVTGKTMFFGIIAFSLFFSFISILEPIFFGKIIKELELFYQTEQFNTNRIISITLIWGGFILFTTLLKYIYFQYFVSRPNLKNYKVVIDKYSKKIIEMSYGEYLSRKIGKTSKILETGTYGIVSFLFTFFELYLINIFSSIFIIIVLFILHVKMALIAISMLPLMLILGYVFSIKNGKRQEKMSKKWDIIFNSLGESMSNFTLIKVLTLESVFYKKISNISASCFKEQIIINKVWNLADIYTIFLVMISRVLVLGFGIFFIIEGTLDLATLFIVFAYIGWLYFPLGNMLNGLRNIVKNITDVKRMFDEFDSIEGEQNISEGGKLKNISGRIIYKNIDFAYSDGKKIINKLNIEITPGEKIALVGSTGAGKSTIANLLLRLWDVDKGEISIDGLNIKSISKQSLRNHIGIVSQDNTLFNMSIKDNLLFANSKATKKDLEIALKKAEANFVFDFPKGMNTVIGERGLKLSGGEKQRLSIARLFLKNPEILILDEATSALDNKTEKLIQKALDTLTKGRTSIVIAHRLSTIQNADKIFMVENGKIVESGKYEELMKNKGKFYGLANPEHLIIN